MSTRRPLRPLQTCRTACSVLGIALLAGHASAQLGIDRTYFGIDRPLQVSVALPADKAGEPSIALFAPDGSEPLIKVPVAAGKADLASIFEQFWSTHASKLHYAQLMVGAEPVGPPLVLQPLSSPKRAVMRSNPATGRPMAEFVDTGGSTSGLRVYPEQHVLMTTTLGEIEFKLRPDHAPNTCWSFMDLVKGGYYTDIKFHRIIGPNFMVQGGDPTGTGSGGPGYNIDLENSKLPHDFGVLSMARTNDPDTGGSQFFVCFSREGTQFLDGSYCAFAQAVRGAETIAAFSAVETEIGPGGEKSKPKNPPTLTSAKLVPAPPFGTGPKPVTRPTAR